MAVGLALCIEVQGKRAPATERLMEQEIQRLQIRDLETIDATMAATFEAITNKVHLHDIHATILHLMGLDHESLTYFHQGRQESLTDVGGRVVRDVIG